MTKNSLPSFLAPVMRGQRDEPDMFRRFFKLRRIDPRHRAEGEAEPDDDSFPIRFQASTDAPVEMYGWKEILSHGKGAIDANTCRALLLNHRPNWIAGPVREITVNEHDSELEADVLASAKMESGITVREAIDSGALQGISVGYTYRFEDCDYDEEQETVTVRKWRLLEASLTPIPADKDCGLRSLPAAIGQRFTPQPATPALPQGTAHMRFSDWLKARGFDETSITDAQKTSLRALFDAEQQPAPAADPAPGNEAARAAELAQTRCELSLRRAATEHSIDCAGFDFAAHSDEASGLRALLAHRASAAPQPILDHSAPAGANGGTTVTRDAADKFRARAVAGLHQLAGRQISETDGELYEFRNAGYMGLHNMVRHCAQLEGRSDAQFWSAIDCADWSSRNVSYQRDAGNNSSGMFSNILSSAAEMALNNGFGSYDESTYQIWSTVRDVSSFKTVKNAGLSAGRLQETAENHAFPSLKMADAGYDSALGMWGCSVDFSYQMQVDDDLGLFLQQLGQAGIIGSRTIDREVYRQLLTATWTNDTTTGAALGTAGNLDKARKGLKNKLSAAGDRLGISPRFLLHDPAQATKVQQDLGIIVAGGASYAAPQHAKSIIPVESSWIGDTSLLSGALGTDYYLAGNSMIFDTVLVNFLAGIRSPIIQQFDAGAVAGDKWKIMLPFQATVATHTDSAAAARVSGLQKATVA